MKGKIKTVIITVLLAALCALGIYLTISFARTLAGLLQAKANNEWYYGDSFWTIDGAIIAVSISLVITAASALGIVGCLLKKIFMYVFFIILLLCAIASCLFLLICGNIISDPPIAAALFAIIAASAAGIVFCIIRLIKKKKEE